MTYCMKCNTDVFGKDKEHCKDRHYNDLDFEGLSGPWRLKRLKPKKKSTLKFKKKINMDSEVPYE